MKPKLAREAKKIPEKSVPVEKIKREISPISPSATIIPSKDLSGGMLQETSTWKAITGIALVLLLISVFTQGFHFSKNPVAGAGLSLSEAEQKTIAYVNANLLQPPFTAEVKKSEQVNELFKITLTVAGQDVDSYLTKDGKIFFPRGFELEQATPEPALASTPEVAPSDAAGNIEVTEARAEEGFAGTEKTAETTEKAAETEAERVVSSTERATPEVRVSLQAKRWLFEPQYVKVKKGTHVFLTLEPTNVAFTFAFPEYNINTEVRGKTTLDFTAVREGKFPFSCSSCEEWRGMKGVLEVE